MYTDETLTCVDCGQPFAFTAGEQEFFAMKGFTNKPSRCTECRPPVRPDARPTVVAAGRRRARCSKQPAASAAA